MRLRASLGTLWTNAIEIRAEHEANCHKCVRDCGEWMHLYTHRQSIWIMMMITLFTIETKWNAFDGVCSFHVAAVYTIPFDSETELNMYGCTGANAITLCAKEVKFSSAAFKTRNRTLDSSTRTPNATKQNQNHRVHHFRVSKSDELNGVWVETVGMAIQTPRNHLEIVFYFTGLERIRINCVNCNVDRRQNYSENLSFRIALECARCKHMLIIYSHSSWAINRRMSSKAFFKFTD